MVEGGVGTGRRRTSIFERGLDLRNADRGNEGKWIEINPEAMRRKEGEGFERFCLVVKEEEK